MKPSIPKDILVFYLISPGTSGHMWLCAALGCVHVCWEWEQHLTQSAILAPLIATPLLLPAVTSALQQFQGFCQIQTQLPSGEREGI